MAEWTHLPKDLIEQISKYLETSIDLLRFRSVCTSWRSSVSPKRSRSLSGGAFRVLPNDGISRTSFGFYLSRRTIFLIRIANSDNQTEKNGWLVKIEEDNSQRKHLLNPLSRYKLNSLPNDFPRVLDLSNFRVFELGQEYVLHHVNYSQSSLSDAANLYMEKVVMIWLNENDSNFVLLTIHVSGKLAMFKSGDKKWTIISEMPSPYDDVIVYKDKFFAVDNTGRTVVVGLDTELGLIANPIFGGDKKYLIESSGDLLLVDMYLSIDTAEGGLSFGEEFLEHLAQYMSERTVRFKVFKLDEEGKSWIKVRNLDDHVLFLGDDSTFSASVSDLSGFRGNCIFFVDNFFYSRDEYSSSNGGDDGVLAGRDIGVFDLETGTIGPLGNYPEYAKIFWPPPSWVTSTSLEVQTQSQLEEISHYKMMLHFH